MILSKIKEYSLLFFINLKVKLKNSIEYLKVIFKYYQDFQFLKIDLYVLSYYLFKNPFKISKIFLLNQGATDIYTYGETPLTTMELIARKCQISKKDVFFELGCGRGRPCFWLAHFIGCNVVGIEYIPEFINCAQRVQKKFKIQGLDFRLENLFQSDLKGATIIYLYGICYSTHEIKTLIRKFESLPKGVKVITVSYSLQDYQANTSYRIIKRFPAVFTWGTTDIILQEKI